MESIFKRLNDNSLIIMYTGIIEDVIKESKEYKMKLIHTYFTEMKSVDKNVLSDKNLAALESLEFYFDDTDISIEGKSKRYKKKFLHILDILCIHESMYNPNVYDDFEGFEKANETDKQYKIQKFFK